MGINWDFVGDLTTRQLSWALVHEEQPDLKSTDWDYYPHPLVEKLHQAHPEHGLDAAQAWHRFSDEHPMSGVVRWMIAGAFKGWWLSDAEFCRDQFGSTEDMGRGSLMDHIAQWDGAARGFSRWADLSPSAVGDLFDWKEWAFQTMNREGAAFRSVPKSRLLGNRDGVYVFDVTRADAGAFVA